MSNRVLPENFDTPTRSGRRVTVQCSPGLEALIEYLFAAEDRAAAFAYLVRTAQQGFTKADAHELEQSYIPPGCAKGITRTMRWQDFRLEVTLSYSADRQQLLLLLEIEGEGLVQDVQPEGN